MSDNSSDASTNTPSVNDTTAAVSGQMSGQPTGLVETTFAETIGLSMHNAITSQQSSQMTTAASVTNACARLLQTGVPVRKAPAKKEKKPQEPAAEPEQAAPKGENKPEDKPKKKFNIMNFLKPKSKSEDSTERTGDANADSANGADSSTEAKS